MYNMDQPSMLENISRIVIIGDVHGDISRLLNCLIHAKIFSNNLKWIAEPNDTVVVQMGDQVDSLNRGNLNEWEELPDIEVLLLMDKLDNIAKLSGGRVLSLIGNHEIMNTMGQFNYVSQNSFKFFPEKQRENEFKFGNRLSKILAKRNIVLKINNFLFCHAGILPEHLDISDNNIHKINEIARKVLRNEHINDIEKNIFVNTVISDNSILWNRIYTIEEDNTDKLINEVLNKTNSEIIFIGHNTVVNTKSAFNNKIIFTDAALSRAYGMNKIEYIDYSNSQINIVKLE